MEDSAVGIPAHRAVAKNGHRATAWFETREADKVALGILSPLPGT